MMPRIRTVKPELFKHEVLYDAELVCQLPLHMAFIALFSCCDREGRFRWRPRRLKIEMLPYDDVDMVQILDALAMHGFIKKYQCLGEWYGCIPSWSRHQHINQRESASEIPSMLEAASCESHAGVAGVPVVPAEPPLVAPAPVLIPECPLSVLAHAGTSDRDGEGKEAEGTGNENEVGNPFVAPETQPIVLSNAIHQIFEHWKTVMVHPNVTLDPARHDLIAKALQSGYDVQQLCQAITGCSITPHNTGDNDRGQRYDGLHVILRDGDQIDRFIHNHNYPPRPITKILRKTQANVRTLQQWMDKKMAEEHERINANA